MSEPFADAALERLSRVLGLSIGTETTSACPGLTVSARPDAGDTLFDIHDWHLFDSLEDTQALAWLSLIELAARAGYADLAAASLAPQACDLAESILERRVSTEEPHVRLVKQLVGRLRPPITSAPADAFDQEAFDAFESYLSLTRMVTGDHALLHAQFTHMNWRHGLDAAALLSPERFAGAVATGYVGEIAVPGIQGMLAALDAFDWLMAIVDRIGHRTELRDGVLVHARWSHAAWVCRERLDEWAVAFSEWPEERDREGEQRWADFRRSVLLPLEQHQARLELSRSENPQLSDWIVRESPEVGWAIDVTPAQLDEWVRDRVAEGRTEAARRSLRLAADNLSDFEKRPTAGEEAARLVDLARQIAALGDPATAAALVAPRLRSIERVARAQGDEATVQTAHDLCAGERRSGVGHAEQDVIASAGDAPRPHGRPVTPPDTPTHLRKDRSIGET